ncbi:hypothetical protein A3L12_06765 [Thermococcus sp. P6]|uniref:hypothetical protein n=1 Tax=Thermococcus sp. P6 TaxID=122420 RepID=UPI000B59B8DF|nr:hypothetical protein [Thermococcus sp. P6]ASJ11025.1 hypothetical protein A3L12_06765 [Thermococcus sp. P6]
MRLIVKPERGLGKIEVELSEETVAAIERLGRLYGVPPQRIVEMALRGEFKRPRGVLKELERRVGELEERTWRLEKEYAPLRFRAYGLSEDNRLLAIELSGLLAENAQLRRFLGMKPERNVRLRRLISYYLKG